MKSDLLARLISILFERILLLLCWKWSSRAFWWLKRAPNTILYPYCVQHNNGNMPPKQKPSDRNSTFPVGPSSLWLNDTRNARRVTAVAGSRPNVPPAASRAAKLKADPLFCFGTNFLRLAFVRVLLICHSRSLLLDAYACTFLLAVLPVSREAE